MNDQQRFLTWCAEGTLIRPDEARASLVDLACALADAAGAVTPSRVTPATRSIAERIGTPEHLVFVLIDGMGAALLDGLDPGTFLRTQRADTLTSVFPSTTASALTTMATGVWPASHSVLGWWVYFPDQAVSATILPFVERYSEAPLAEFGVTPELAFPVASMSPGFRSAPVTLLPERIAKSTYSRYHTGGTPVSGYKEVREGFDAVATRVTASAAPTFTYLYLPQLDALSHERGPDDAGVGRLLETLDGECARLRKQLPHNTRMVIAADHGQTPVLAEREFIVEYDDPLLDLLRCPPCGEPTVPMFHVTPGEAERFAEVFRARFGDVFALLSIDEAEELHLFGPAPISATARGRAGDFLAIAAEPAVLYHVPQHGPRVFQPGVHAGLTPREMLIPLVIA
jgi:hypothetical protein|tara:strand:+ start:3413 stop:4612 length:1200 start_codon:yes stop_codon:yes gene_type:complete